MITGFHSDFFFGRRILLAPVLLLRRVSEVLTTARLFSSTFQARHTLASRLACGGQTVHCRVTYAVLPVQLGHRSACVIFGYISNAFFLFHALPADQHRHGLWVKAPSFLADCFYEEHRKAQSSGSLVSSSEVEARAAVSSMVDTVSEAVTTLHSLDGDFSKTKRAANEGQSSQLDESVSSGSAGSLVRSSECRKYGRSFASGQDAGTGDMFFSVQVNSYHHQGVRELGRGLTAIAYSEDGLVEAFCETDMVDYRVEGGDLQPHGSTHSQTEFSPHFVVGLQVSEKPGTRRASVPAWAVHAGFRNVSSVLFDSVPSTLFWHDVSCLRGVHFGSLNLRFSGVSQFHPERMAEDYPGCRRIFKAFVSACRKYKRGLGFPLACSSDSNPSLTKRVTE